MNNKDPGACFIDGADPNARYTFENCTFGWCCSCGHSSQQEHDAATAPSRSAWDFLGRLAAVGTPYIIGWILIALMPAWPWKALAFSLGSVVVILGSCIELAWNKRS